MARIAIAVVGAVAGALVGLLAPPFGVAMMWESVALGAAAGAGMGNAIGGMFFRPQVAGMLPLQDRQVSSSADGSPIPYGYGRGRLAGQVIWSPGIEYHTVGDSSSKGAGQPTGLSYFYLASFAAAWGEGPGAIERVWADSKLIYAGGAQFGTYSPWNSETMYQPDDLVSYQFLPTGRTDAVTAIFQCTIANQGIEPAGDSLHWLLTSYAYWNSTILYQPGNQVAYPPGNGQLYAPTSGQIYTCVNPNTNVTPAPGGDWLTMQEYYPAPTLYTGARGDTTQMPDPTIQANNGVGATPAFRGLVYAVWENMPLATFGNRVPNLRAQVNYQVEAAQQPSGFVQQAFVGVNGPTTATVVLAAAPKVGNTLVALCGGAGGAGGPRQQGYINAPAGFTLLDNVAVVDGAASCWAWSKPVEAGDGTSYTFALQYGSPDNFAVIEVLGTAAISFVDGTDTSSTEPFTTSVINPGGQALILVVFGWWWAGTASGLLPGGAAFSQSFNGTGGALFAGWDAFGFDYAISANIPNNHAYIVLTIARPPAPPPPAVPALSDVVLDLCLRSGLVASQVDTSLLEASEGSPSFGLVFPSSEVNGYIVERMVTAAAAIKELMVAYFFGACESDGVLKFVPRTFLTQGQGSPPSVFTIVESDLGIAADKAKLEEVFAQEQDLPLSVTVLYNDIALNWQQGKQVRQRDARFISARNQQLLSIPLSLSDDTAIQIAEATLYSAWQQRQSFSTNLWKALYMLLDPTDIVYLQYEGATYEIRVISDTLGQGFVTALKAVSEDVRNYGSVAVGAANLGFVASTPIAALPTFLFVLDLALLQDADSNPTGSGFYAVLASNQAGWKGGVLYSSVDDASFTQMDSVTRSASWGNTLNALPAPVTPWAWDTVNTLNISLASGILTGDTDANVLAGANALVVGQEILQFANAVQNTDGTWTVSRLLRGRRGTDAWCYGHAAGELVLQPLAGGVLREAAPLTQLGQLRYYRGVTVGQDVSAAADVDLTLQGHDLKPYSPVAISGSLDSGNNWIMAWIRRTRCGGAYGTGAEALVDGVGGPVNEQTEAYQVDILGGSPLAVVRTLDVSSPYAVYTEAMQVEDFGSVQTMLEIDVYQMSAVVGRGWPGMALLPCSSDAPIVPPV